MIDCLKIAVIPARGGSKRIPRKNIKEFCGKPIIGWAIEAAIRAYCFDHVLVSTDDIEIAGVAERFGALIPFMRPESLADDMTPTIPVIAHAIDAFESAQEKGRRNCLLHLPDSCLCTPILLAKAMRTIENEAEAAYVMPIVDFPSAIQRAIKLGPNDALGMFYPEFMKARTQDLERAYYDPGQFYVGRARAWREGVGLFGGLTRGMVIPSPLAHDIDTPEDWQIAEAKFRSIIDSVRLQPHPSIRRPSVKRRLRHNQPEQRDEPTHSGTCRWSGLAIRKSLA